MHRGVFSFPFAGINYNNPDAGTDTYTYDGAGNVTTHATQVLANANKSIHYYYTYNRLDSIVYPNNPQNNVRYTYGDSTAGNNQRGRIALLEDASGFQTFIYGKMGEVIENNRTFVLPNETYPYSFNMKYTYDSWNRVQDITYPDGEVVRYHYNTGGLLRRVQGEKRYNTASIDTLVPFFPHDTLVPFPHNVGDPTTDIDYNNDTVGGGSRDFFAYYYYDYIDSIRYNEFELKSGQWYGNGTHSHYRYDILQRLDSLKLYDANGHELQKIKYTYDKVGNITRISNSAAAVSSLGGTYTYTYKYDLLYRLTLGSGSVGSLKPLANYSLNMQYEADGRIIQKNQSGQTRLNGTVQTFNDSKSYSYNTSQPHTVKMVGNTNYQWDANGNMVKDGAAVLTWDEENRLVSHTKSLCSTSFFYDASGERFYKNTGSTVLLMINGEWQFMTLYTDPTLYTSPYIVATKDGYTKHYFVENERFASRIGDGTIIALNTHATTASALAAKQAKVNDAAPDSIQPDKLSNLRSLPYNWSEHHTTYWQHSDHLGSASWVTDTNGLGYQHMQYMPWGEPLLDQRKSGYTYNTRYTFSGKERDEETGYSYFGARHYNSALSIWLSVDPMSDKYPSTSPYTYCANNPVKLVDPNGEYGVLALSQGKQQDVVWTGKVRVSTPAFQTATLRMTYYYSTGSTEGSLTNEQIAYVKSNITDNLNPLVGCPISVNGKEYFFNHHIDFVEVSNATGDDLYKKTENATYYGGLIGNFIQAKTLEGGDFGEGSQYSMLIDFPKMFAKKTAGVHDGQTPIHELLHNIGADDIKEPGEKIMNMFDNTNPFSYRRRSLEIDELNGIINRPYFTDRITIINE